MINNKEINIDQKTEEFTVMLNTSFFDLLSDPNNYNGYYL